MAKVKPLGMGFVGIFGRKDGGMWISGTLSKAGAERFKQAKAGLEVIYREVYGHLPKTIGKTDVFEFALMGPTVARQVFRGLQEEARARELLAGVRKQAKTDARKGASRGARKK